MPLRNSQVLWSFCKFKSELLISWSGQFKTHVPLKDFNIINSIVSCYFGFSRILGFKIRFKIHFKTKTYTKYCYCSMLKNLRGSLRFLKSTKYTSINHNLKIELYTLLFCTHLGITIFNITSFSYFVWTNIGASRVFATLWQQYQRISADQQIATAGVLTVQVAIWRLNSTIAVVSLWVITFVWWRALCSCIQSRWTACGAGARIAMVRLSLY